MIDMYVLLSDDDLVLGASRSLDGAITLIKRLEIVSCRIVRLDMSSALHVSLIDFKIFVQ